MNSIACPSGFTPWRTARSQSSGLKSAVTLPRPRVRFGAAMRPIAGASITIPPPRSFLWQFEQPRVIERCSPRATASASEGTASGASPIVHVDRSASSLRTKTKPEQDENDDERDQCALEKTLHG